MTSGGPNTRLRLIQRVYTRWSALNLAGQFAVAALLVLTCGMTLVGVWVTSRIERGVLQSTANTAAVYINSFIEPHLQDLGGGTRMKPAAERILDAFKDTPLGHKIIDIRVWAPDGTVLYSTSKALTGRKLALSDRLQPAWRGEISADLSAASDVESEVARARGLPLFEIYAPIRGSGTKRVIAVAEVYEDASQLQAELRNARLQSWYIVALVTLAMLSVLFGIVRTGSDTIAAQDRSLRERIAELSGLLTQNEGLHRRIDEIHRRSVETNDLVLRRIGLELHDGPAQLISLALLRLDALRPKTRGNVGEDPAADDFERIQSALIDSLAEIRNMSAGLTLPELDTITPAQALALAGRTHERRTGTTVRSELEQMPPHLSNALKACLYRFAQEALNNAYRHGGGRGQTVRGRLQDEMLEVEVSDAGPGFEPRNGNGMDENRLGLTGMRDRVASLGGTLEVQSVLGQGTRLTARFKVKADSGIEEAGDSR